MRTGFGLYVPHYPTGGFSPTDLAGLVAWYDASDTATITDSGGAVSQWDDKSGNAHHATQGSGSNKPTTGTRTQNGLNVLDFDGGDFLSATFTEAPTARFVAIVWATDNNNSEMTLLGGSSGDSFEYRHRYFAAAASYFSILQSGVSHHQAQVAPGMASNGTAYLAACQFDPTSDASKLWMNGDNVATVGGAWTYSSATTTNYIGKANDGNNVNGFIAELIIVDAVVSSDDRTSVWDYLNAKWAIF